VYIAPSGVQKERVQTDDMFIYGEDEQLIETPCKKHLRPSACTPLFFNAYRVGAGAVIHTYPSFAQQPCCHVAVRACSSLWRRR
jgi:methylthioribulose-1-phosphate dehydratase